MSKKGKVNNLTSALKSRPIFFKLKFKLSKLIYCYFNFNYELKWKIIDERQEFQLHKPLYATTYYLTPQYHYSPSFKSDAHIKIGLYTCIERMVTDPLERCKIYQLLESFKDAKVYLPLRLQQQQKTRNLRLNGGILMMMSAHNCKICHSHTKFDMQLFGV